MIYAIRYAIYMTGVREPVRSSAVINASNEQHAAQLADKYVAGIVKSRHAEQAEYELVRVE